MKVILKFFVIFMLCAALMPLSVVGQTIKVSSLKGVWERVGYSELIDIGDDEVHFYDLTTISLILKDSMPIAAFDQLMGEVKADQNVEELTVLPSDDYPI